MIASNFSSRRQQEVPRVVEHDVRLRVGDDVEVVLREVPRDDPRHERLDLGDRQAFDVRIDRHGAGGHARAAADHQHRLRILRNQRRHVAEHPLQPHVLRLARRLDLAGVVIVEHAVRQARDRHRGVPAFAHVDDLGFADARGRVAAVGDEHARHRVNRARQQHGAAHRGRQQQRAGELEARLLRFGIGGRGLEHQQRRDGGDDDQHLLRALAAEPDDEQQAGGDRADDRPERVGGVDAADQPRRDPCRRWRPRRAPAGSSRPRESRPAEWPRGSGRNRAES